MKAYSGCQHTMHAQEISKLEGTVAAMQINFEKTLSASSVSQKELQDSLVSAKHELLRVQDQLTLAEKVYWTLLRFNAHLVLQYCTFNLHWYSLALLAFLLLSCTINNRFNCFYLVFWWNCKYQTNNKLFFCTLVIQWKLQAYKMKPYEYI